MRFLRKKVGLVIGLFMLFSASTYSQAPEFFDVTFEPYDFEFNGNGARAMGMGNAFLGVSDDITSISWNPAGMYKMESPVIGFSFTTLNPKGEFQSNRYDFNTGTNLDERVIYGQSGSVNSLTQASFLAPLRIKGHPFVGSIAYSRNSNEFRQQGYQLDIIEQFPVFNEVGVFLGIDTVEAAVDIQSRLEGGIDAINVGFGTRLHSNLALGASLNVYSGKTNRHTDITAVGDSLPVNNRQYAELGLVQQEDDSNSFSGFNVTVGLKLDGEVFDAGLVVRTPFSLNQKGQSVSSEIVNANDVPLDTDTTYQIDLLTKYDIPLMVGFGLGYQMKENWLLALDMEYRHFSSAQIKIRENLILVPGGSNIEEFRILSDNEWQWSNVFIVRGGTEFLHETGIGTIPLRAGVGYVPLPSPNIDSSGTRSTSVSYEFSLGTGLHLNQIKLDLGYMYKTYDLKNNGFLAEDRGRNHFLNFSFTGYF